MSDELTVILGRYELHTLIGEGGMASVWRAQDLTLARPVAVKLLYARDERDRQALVDSFLREARIAASVQHRNVVHIVDFGTTEEEQPFMVMELLEGQNLGDKLSSETPLTTTEFLRITSMTLRGLDAVHQADIIHRDLKPENIFLTSDGNQLFPKILDFGISRSATPASGRRSALVTKEGVIVGTPEYMSPEQARGMRTIDSRTDIYSMGVILYEGLTGQTPFSSENVGDLIIDIVTGTIKPVCELNPNIPVELSNVVAKATARDPGDRYQTAMEFQDALLSVAEDLKQFRRSLSDFPAPTAPQPASSQPVLKLGAIDDDDTSEFALNEESSQIEALPLHPSAIGGPTTDRVEPYPLVARRKRMRNMFLVGAIGLGAGLGLLLTGSEQKIKVVEVKPVIPQTAAAATPIVATPTAEPEQVPTAPTKMLPVTVELTGLPAGARVSVDGQLSTQNPLELARDGAKHVITVVSRGRTWKTTHVASDDGKYTVKFRVAKTTAKRNKRKKKKKSRSPRALRNLDF